MDMLLKDFYIFKDLIYSIKFDFINSSQQLFATY